MTTSSKAAFSRSWILTNSYVCCVCYVCFASIVFFTFSRTRSHNTYSKRSFLYLHFFSLHFFSLFLWLWVYFYIYISGGGFLYEYWNQSYYQYSFAVPWNHLFSRSYYVYCGVFSLFFPLTYILALIIFSSRYGDIRPTTATGQITITLAICFGAIIVIPYYVTKFMEKISRYSPYMAALPTNLQNHIHMLKEVLPSF